MMARRLRSRFRVILLVAQQRGGEEGEEEEGEQHMATLLLLLLLLLPALPSRPLPTCTPCRRAPCQVPRWHSPGR